MPAAARTAYVVKATRADPSLPSRGVLTAVRGSRRHRQSGRETTVRVEDRGPYVPGRILDVAPRAADDLGMRRQGVAPVVVEPVAVPQPDGSVKPGAAARRRGGQR